MVWFNGDKGGIQPVHKGIQTHKATVSFTPNKKTSVSRRVQRHKRVIAAIFRAMRDADEERVEQLRAEAKALEGSLLEEKAEIEAILKNQADLKSE